MKRVILLGNMPTWRSAVSESVDASRYGLLEAELNADTIELPFVDAILPLRLEEYCLIRQSPVARRKAIIPTPETVALADDKFRFNDWLVHNGFQDCTPRVIQGPPSFPCILKKRIDWEGRNCRIFRSAAEWEASDNPDYFLQTYIPGRHEFVTHTISLDGRIVYASSHRHTYATPFFVKGAFDRPPLRTFDLGPFVPKEMASILKLLGYSGCACFNYKLANGIPAIFEMNPRVGGSFIMHTNQYLQAYSCLVALGKAMPEAKVSTRFNPAKVSKERIRSFCWRGTKFIGKHWHEPAVILKRPFQPMVW